MKTTMKRKRKKRDVLKATVLKNNLMNRFIREIEREEPLDSDTLKTMLALQPVH